MRARLWQRRVVKVSERDEGGRGRPKVQLGGTRREHAARPLRPGRHLLHLTKYRFISYSFSFLACL